MTTKKQLLSKKEFLKFYNTEMDLESINGITMCNAYYNELKAMYKIYSNSSNDKEFTDNMATAGYGKIK